jgi:hypothetical protein
MVYEGLKILYHLKYWNIFNLETSWSLTKYHPKYHVWRGSRCISRVSPRNSHFTNVAITCIHFTHASSKGQRHLRHFSETPTFYQNYLAMRNTTDVTGGKSITIWSQVISGVSAVNPLVAFNDIHGRKREVIFFYFVPDPTRDFAISYDKLPVDLTGGKPIAVWS